MVNNDFRERVITMATNLIIDYMKDDLSRLARDYEREDDKDGFSEAVWKAIRHDLVDEPKQAAVNGRISHMVAAIGDRFMGFIDIAHVIENFWIDDDTLRMYDRQMELITSLHKSNASPEDREAIAGLQLMIADMKSKREASLKGGT